MEMEKGQGDQRKKDLQIRLNPEFKRDPKAATERFLRGVQERHNYFQKISEGFKRMPKSVRDLRIAILTQQVAMIDLDALNREIFTTIQTEEDELRRQQCQHPDWQRIPVESQSVP